MNSDKNFLAALKITFFVLMISETAHAKSVYVISNTETSQLKAYEVQDANLTWQANYVCESDPIGIVGAVGLAIDESNYDDFLFVTFEGQDYIELINAKTMQYMDTVTATGATNLAGIAMDKGKNKLYVVERYTDHLYSYSWCPATKTLTPDFVQPYYIELEGLVYGIPKGAFGIDLDEENSRLYVADNTDSIKYYDTNEWSKIGEVNNVSCNVISIAIDVNNQLLYYGSMGGYGQGDTHLYKYNISSETESSVDIGCSVAGIAVDQETGLIYITTYGDEYNTNYPTPPEDHLMVYNSSLTRLWESGDIGNPAGVAVGSTAAYKPPFPLLELVKDDNDVSCASPLISQAEYELLGTPYNWLYYRIEYDANGFADTNVVITDYLPVEVDYYSSDPCGLYDANTHTVTWYIGDMSASDSNTFWLQVGVNHYARPGYAITNYCEIESDQYCTFTKALTEVCCYGGNIIYVNQDANDPNSYHNGTSWFNAYTDLQDALLTTRTCSFNQIWVAEGTYIPIETYSSNINARAISFELASNVGIFGGFPNTGDPNWSDRDWQTHITTLSGDIGTPDNPYDNSYHVVKCVNVNNAILNGFTITYGNADGSNLEDPDSRGGGIYDYNSSSLMITNSTINDNMARYGGGMYNKYSSSSVNNCIFTDNTVDYEGGGMYNEHSSPALVNCTFTRNASTSKYSSYGGAMYNTQSSPTIIGCTFGGNSVGAYGKGGAMYNTNFSEPNMTNCTFGDNSASEGGAVYNIDSEMSIINCVLTGNDADFSGGAVYAQNSTLNVTNCIFAGDKVNNDSGGGIYNSTDSEPNITNCIFTGNKAFNYGGAIYNYQSTATVANCFFTGNNADYYGGGIYNYQCLSAIVTNCIFSGNNANKYGGGMANKENVSLVTNCTFTENKAYYGGGTCNWYNSDSNFTNCIFWDNDANTGNDEIFDNSEISVTCCDVKGGWAGTGNINEDPCFFEVDTPTGSWTDNAFYDGTTFQSTLTDSYASWAVNELAGRFVNPDTLNQKLQFFIVSNDANTIKVWSDVRTIATSGKTYRIYDYHLTIGSACIDAGYPAGDYAGQKDIDGEPRVFDGDSNGTEIVDIGADEYYWSPADFNSDGIVNFFDYALLANVWLTTPVDLYYDDIYDLVDNNCIDSNDLGRFCEEWLWQTAWAKTFPFAYGQTMGTGLGMSQVVNRSLVVTQGLYPSVLTEVAQPEVIEVDIEVIKKWLIELWLTEDELRKMISEDEWFKFIESVVNSK
jgi:hypothetical protein